MSVVVLVAVLVPVLIWAKVEEERQWQDFVKQNDCRVIEYVKAKTTTAYVFGKAGGQIQIEEPGRTVFECKGGVRYSR